MKIKTAAVVALALWAPTSAASAAGFQRVTVPDSTRPDYVVVPGAGHFAFVACSAEMAKRAPAVCQDAPGFDRQAFHRELNSAVVAFFKARLPRP